MKLPTITEEDRKFLHYNPNTSDVVEWVQNYARQAISDVGHCECSACVTLHASDCSVHNEPAYPKGPCDCGATNSLYTADQLREAQAKVLREAAKEAALDGGTAYVAAWLLRMSDELEKQP